MMHTGLLLASLLGQSFLIQDTEVYVGNGDIKTHVDVWIEGDKIKAIGSQLPAPSSVKIISGKGKILTPGLMETVSQLGLVEVLLEESTEEHSSRARPFALDFDVRKGFDAKSPRLAIERAEGVTHLIISPTGGVISGNGAYVDLDGSWPQTAVGIFGGVTLGSLESVGKSHTGVWQKLGWLIDDVRRYEKTPHFYEKGHFDQLRFRREVILGMLPVLQGKITFLVRAENERDLRNLIALKQKEGIDIWIIGGSESWLIAKDLATAKIPIVLTPSKQRPTNFEKLRARDDLPRLLEEAGVIIVLSSSNWDQNVRRLRQEGGLAVREGMSYQKALSAMTYVPARLLGFSNLGLVQPGQKANIVLWDSDPFELSTTISGVWIGGRQMPSKNRQDALFERYAPVLKK